MPIKDCFGNVAVVGDEIAYSVGNSGAKSWEISKITRITDKSIFFNGQPGDNWRQGEIIELRRGNGCFVIKNNSLISKSNAWDKLDSHIDNLTGMGSSIRDEVSKELYKNGCTSATIHYTRFIDKLIERIEDYEP